MCVVLHSLILCYTDALRPIILDNAYILCLTAAAVSMCESNCSTCFTCAL
ncbi:hypothetical protein DsansV1_C26g0194081 [Dioscorea sansibarensis]